MAILQTYSSATAGLAPLAHWRFDETSGTTAIDQADGHDGSYQGNPALAAGSIGDGAASFDGSGTFVEVTTASAGPVRLAFIGDSLVAGYGFGNETFEVVTEPVADAFASDLTLALEGEGFEIEPIVDGRNDRYTEEALGRVDDVLARAPDAVVLVLGTNDLLNGVDPAETAANLTQIVQQFQAEGVEVLLSGFFGLWPDEAFDRPGYDTTDPDNAEALAAQFEAIFPTLATELGVDLFDNWHGGERIGSEIVGGTLGDPNLNQGDGVHPNAAGVDQIVERILPQARDLVLAAGAEGGDDPLAVAAGSIEMWFQPDALGTTQALFGKGEAEAGAGDITALLLADGAVAVTVVGDAGPITVQSAAGVVGPDQAAQIVIGFGPGGLQLYVDGVLVAEDGFEGGLVDNTAPLLIGRAAGADAADFAGVVDEFVFHTQNLDGAQVADLFAAGRAGGVLVGSSDDDQLIGGVDDEVFDGRGGADDIRAGEGDDRLVGGQGDDSLLGEGGDDALEGSDGADTLRGGAGDDILQGNAGGDRLTGGKDADRLLGNKGEDDLRGGAGDDLLDGGLGRDLLDGGAGADIFRVSGLGDGVDKVGDFEAGLGGDVLDLSALLDFTDGADAGDFVGLIEIGGSTKVTVDPAGQGGDGTVVLNLLDVTGLSVDQLVADGNLQLA